MVTTTYTVRFEADCDTSSAVSTVVNVWPLPEPIIVEGLENVCTNGPLYRYVAGGLPGSVFNWNITNGTIVNDFNDTIYVDWGSQIITGTIELTETSVNGCVSEPLTLEVEVGGPVLDLGGDTYICEGEVLELDPGGNYDSYLWQDGSTGGSFTTGQEGWISLEVADPYGCIAKDSVYLSVYDLPVVDLGPDTSVCGDVGVTLDAGTDGISYRWSTGDISQMITLFMGGGGKIWAEVENDFGCLGRDTVMVSDCSLEFYFRDIPTAITPSDGNGLNDYWEIDKLSTFSQAVVEIFDRWGTLVWRSEPGYSSPWDGRNMRGEEMPMDSYHFVIELNTGNKHDFITGIITVIR
jgi:gliding motility-associated-like protein